MSTDVPARLAVLGNPATLAARARSLGIALEIRNLDRIGAAGPHVAGTLPLVAVDQARPTRPGELDAANAASVLAMLEAGADACLTGAADALVTAPVQKSNINAAGVAFSGHTEFLAERTGATHPVMLLAGPKLRVALATTHLPLAAVPAAITRPSLTTTLRILDRDLRSRFRIDRPRITVLGLNPHAGESGVLGREEIETIGPVVEQLRTEGLAVTGPVSADTAFTPAALAGADVVLAMYHDQGLPVLKASGFGEIVNVTLGLPIVRTSVDHGTALALAGSGKASHASLRAALDLALELCRRPAG